MIEFLAILFGVLFVLALPLAVPPALKEKSWRRFFIVLILSVAGVVLPLFVFLVSSMMKPDWKGDCVHGWLDCFITSKLALTPLVLMATAALYALEIRRVENRSAPWIVVGIFVGAIISSICFVFGVVCIGFKGDPFFFWWLLVPFYVAVWYSGRAVQLIRASGFDFRAPLISFAFSLPFWLASWLWSRSLYTSLPDKGPDCFIVTAAGRGHATFVGRHIRIGRNGRSRLVNQQLITFWQFENLWRHFAPRSHHIFRRAYNRVGPVIAARIKSPWLADLTYLAIKPLEVVARLVNAMPSWRNSKSNPSN
jgi:hypothetical protein